ncbi:MAG: hypothetical protein ACR2GY_08330 [Phycisphaerales bacterium]
MIPRIQIRNAAGAVFLLTITCSMAQLGGCAITNLAGGMAQNAEYQKIIKVPAEYRGLTGKQTAVLVDVDQSVMYTHPEAPNRIATGIAYALQKDAGAHVIHPAETMTWQARTPGWSLMAYGDMAEVLGAERIVIVEVYEYRLNPPGNRYEWDGVCAATVRVVEADPDTIDPNTPKADYDVIERFPGQTGIVREAATASDVEAGLLLSFIRGTAWLFYDHEEPKYPDKYRPELDSRKKNK